MPEVTVDVIKTQYVFEGADTAGRNIDALKAKLNGISQTVNKSKLSFSAGSKASNSFFSQFKTGAKSNILSLTRFISRKCEG